MSSPSLTAYEILVVSVQNGFYFSSGGGGVSQLTMIRVKIEALAAGIMI